MGNVRQWGCPLGPGCACPEPHLPGDIAPGGLNWQETNGDKSPEPLVPGLQLLWGRAEGQLLQRVPGIFSGLQAGGFFHLATQKMRFDLIQ